MKTMRLTTWIDAPVERCFKLALSVDLYLERARLTGEELVGGQRGGLLGLNDRTAWSGSCLGLRFRHTGRIDVCRPFTCFRETMVEGSFSRFDHERHFAAINDGTRMRDEVRFAASWGLLSAPAELLLRRRLVRLLKERNRLLKQVAESEEWQRYLVAEVKRKPQAASLAERSQREKVLYRA